MRDQDKPASLAELMGKTSGAQMSADDLPQLLGEKMPELPKNRIGRFRLMNSLKLRFGPGFKNIPGIKDVISDFDKDIEIENAVKRNLEARKDGNPS